jgi:hypothetical protein
MNDLVKIEPLSLDQLAKGIRDAFDSCVEQYASDERRLV